MTFSAAATAWQAADRLIHPRTVHDLAWVAADLSVRQAHEITEIARRHLLHHVRRLTDAIIHVNPPDGPEAHAITAHHIGPASPRARQRPQEAAPRSSDAAVKCTQEW